MILMIDNYDSFTWNLVQYLGELGALPKVVRNDEVTTKDVAALAPAAIVISPGPGRPSDAGVSSAVVKEFAGKVPILGVCLGHQCIGEVFGGQVVRAERLVHGKTSAVIHTGRGIFLDVDNPFQATRYHSLVVAREGLPDALQVVAWTPENEIMAIRHRDHETWGVQFHPESILTPQGKDLLRNFLRLVPGLAVAEAPRRSVPS
ncbi:MAG TPA: aminodeoxychorismate/anthranilate synthase component II [Candidatus Eisenbacteria bacterium]|nr:aminodeoxychorismate/anthranilate synthase component II [Candidatus Eisenbacteria bacterium]